MVDSAQTATSTDAPVRIVRKSLDFELQKQNENIKAVQALLSSISDDLGHITIPAPLKVFYGSEPLGATRFTGSNTIKQIRVGDSGEVQKSSIYPSDVAALLVDIRNWAESSFPDRSTDLPDKKTFDRLRELVNRLPTGEITEADFWNISERSDIKEAKEGLIQFVQGLAPSIEEFNYAALDNLITTCRTNPSGAVEAWKENILVLAKGLEATKFKATAVTLTKPIPLSTEPPNYRLVDVRKVLRYFVVESLRKVIENTSLLPAKTRNKTIQSLLTETEINRIKNDTNLVFPEEIDAATQITGDSNVVNEANSEDQYKNRFFLDFFVEQKVMARLLGDEKLAAEKAGGTAEEEGVEGGGAADETPATPPQPSTYPLDQAVDTVTDQCLADVFEKLNVINRIQAALTKEDTNYTKNSYYSVFESIQQQLTQLYLSRDQIIQAIETSAFSNTETGETVSFYDPDTKTVSNNDLFKSWLKIFIAERTQAIVSEADADDLVIQSVAMVLNAYHQSTADRKAADEKQSSGLAAILATITQPEERARVEADFALFQGLTPEERMATFARTHGAEYRTLNERLNSLLLIYLNLNSEHRLAWQEIPADLRGEFNQEVQAFLLTLSPQDWALLGSPAYQLLLTARFNRYFQLFGFLNPRFAVLCHQFLQQRKELIKEELAQEFLIDGGVAFNFDNAVDSLLILTHKPQTFVNQLNAEKIKFYFDITVSEENQVERFKALLLEYVTVRLNNDEKPAGTLELKEVTDDQVSQVANLTRKFGLSGTTDYIASEYGEIEDEDDQTKKKIGRLWSELSPEERKQLYYQVYEYEEPENKKEQRQQLAQVPPQFKIADYLETFNQPEESEPPRFPPARALYNYANDPVADQQSPSRRLLRGIGFGQRNPFRKVSNSLQASGATAAAATVSQFLLPGAGTVVNGLLQLLPEKYRKYGAVGILGGIGLAIGNAIRLFFSSWGGFIGGTLGGVLGFAGGAVGTVPGLFMGSYAGSAAQTVIEKLTGVNVGGPKDIGFIKNITGDLFSGASNAAANVFSPSASVAASGGKTAPFFNTITIASTGAIAAAAVVSMTTIQSAFLAPLPTTTITGMESEYVIIKKIADPTQKDNPTTISYTVSIEAKAGYTLKLTKPPTDTITINYNEEKNPDGPKDHPASASYDAFKAELVTLNNKFVTTTPTQLPEYSIDFGASGDQYNHASITNRFEITFDVYEGDELSTTPTATNQTAGTTAFVCFGECPMASGGNWPASGRMIQGPGSTPTTGTTTHGTPQKPLEALDILRSSDVKPQVKDTCAWPNVPVYATFPGTANAYQMGSGPWRCKGANASCYGNYVVLTTDAGYTLGFAHLARFASDFQAGSSKQVKPGDLMACMGNTGMGDIHLHYEARGTKMEMIVPGPIEIGPVKSSYDVFTQ